MLLLLLLLLLVLLIPPLSTPIQSRVFPNVDPTLVQYFAFLDAFLLELGIGNIILSTVSTRATQISA